MDRTWDGSDTRLISSWTGVLPATSNTAPTQVLSIANFAAGQAGARVTGGSADSRPMEALAEAAELLAQSKLVIKVQTFPFDRAADAYRVSLGGHVRGKLVLIP